MRGGTLIVERGAGIETGVRFRHDRARFRNDGPWFRNNWTWLDENRPRLVENGARLGLIDISIALNRCRRLPTVERRIAAYGFIVRGVVARASYRRERSVQCEIPSKRPAVRDPPC
jgi:hypothetical protein